MKRNVSLTLALSALVGSTLVALATQSSQSAVNFDWMAFGESLNKGSKFKLGTAEAKQIVAKVADQMIRLNVPVNNGWGGRVSSGVKYGQSDVGTCSYINTAIQRSLLGAGFRQDQIFGVIGVSQGSENAGVATEAQHTGSSIIWLNIEHIAPAIVIDNEVMVFDLWHHAYDTGSYSGVQTSRWNGIDLAKWFTTMGRYPGLMFSQYDLSPAPNQKAMHAETLRELIRESQYYQRFPHLKPTAAKPPLVSHWSFVEAKALPINNPPPRSGRYDRGKAEGGQGSLTVTREWNDMQLATHSCSVNMTWTADRDLTYLKPGDKFTVKGRVKISGEMDRTSVGVFWHPPGFPAHVVHTSRIDLFRKDYVGAGEAFSFTGEVPKRASYPQGPMVLRFVAHARGSGAVDYTYKWVDKK